MCMYVYMTTLKLDFPHSVIPHLFYFEIRVRHNKELVVFHVAYAAAVQSCNINLCALISR